MYTSHTGSSTCNLGIPAVVEQVGVVLVAEWVKSWTDGLEVQVLVTLRGLPHVLEDVTTCPWTPGLNTVGSAFVKTLISQHWGKFLGNKIMN